MTRQARLPAALILTLAVGLAVTGCARSDEPGGSASSSSPSTEASMTTPSAPASAPPSASPSATEAAGQNVITTPADGATVAGPQVAVTGVGTAFEATLRWRVVTAGTTDVVKEDVTTAGANGELGPFAFTVELPAGSYTLEVWEPGAQDDTPETPRHALTTSTFTVT